MKSKKKMIIISSIIALVVVVIVAFVALYFMTDIFKTPKQLFFKYMGRELQSETNISYNDMLEKLKSNKEKSYISNTNLKLNMEADSESDLSSNSEEVYDIVNKLDFNMEQSVKPKENKSYNKLNIGYDEKELATVELIQNDDTYALKSDYIDEDKYVAIENKNLKEFFKKMGVDEDDLDKIPDQITTIDPYELLYISREDQKSIMKTYKKFIDENIPDDNFKVNNKVDININGENKKTTQYILTLNEKEATDIVINLMKTLKQDDVTLNLIIDKYNKYIENTIAGMGIKSTSYALDDEEDITMTKEKLTDYIDEAIEEMEDSKEDASEDSTVSISLYQSKGEICRAEIEKDEEKVITIDRYQSNNRKYIEIVVPTKETSYTSSKRRKKEMTVENKVIIDYIVEKQNDEVNIEGNIKVTKDSEEEGNVKFNINEKGQIGKGINETNVELSSIIEGNTIKLNLNNKTEYKNDIEVMDFSNDKDNVVILNEMSKSDITKLFEEISDNFQTKISEKLDDLGLMKSGVNSYLESTDSNEEDSDYDWEVNTNSDID